MDDAAEPTKKRQMHCGCGGPQRSRKGSAMHDSARPTAAALEILDERFARGEIDKAEYLEKKQLISQRVSVPKVNEPEQRPVVAESTPTTTFKRTPRRR